MRDPLSQREFVALMAMLFATVALSIDAMLPALPQIAATLSPEAPNLAQLVVTSFVLGMGAGTLISGPMSDAFGRKPVLIGCACLYLIGAALCFVAPTLHMLLAARVLQGLGAAGPRAVGTAMVRDLFKGREMARVISFVMMVFTLVPAVAPLMGRGVMLAWGWREIFLVLMAFSLLINAWLSLRQPETLPPGTRRPLHLALLWSALKELVRHRTALVSTACQTLTLASLFATLSSMQGIFETTFDRAASFPLWFTLIALCAMSGSFVNSRVVVGLGMRRVLVATYVGQVGLTALVLAGFASGALGPVAFPAFMVWAIGVFAMMGLTMGNLNALAMESLGHIAGFAASLITAISNLASVALAVPVGQALDGTPLPLLTGVLIFSTLALILMTQVRKTPH
jgi:DHA1 family bicyclomycin/chloramphenicol resistance-like MFS transporter